jgi:hypothetical protein
MSASLVRPIALGHVGGAHDHAIDHDGRTFCGVENRGGLTVVETCTTTELHHVTCGRCANALRRLGLVEVPQ